MNQKYQELELEKIRAETRTKERQIWLIIYSDMTTNLSLFFLVLFAFTRLAAPAREKLYAQLQKHFAKETVEITKPEVKPKTDIEELKKFAYVEETLKEIRITLPSPVLFDLNRAELKPQAINILQQIAKVLRETDYPIIVEGHTDSQPITGGPYQSNWHLSAARAFSVIEYFIKKENIPPERLSSAGLAEYAPVAPNDTEENRAKNRRIEIVLVKL